MHTSKNLLATLKETPADAEIISHQLMLRAGLIRQVAAGIYNWLPLGMRVLHKVQAIVRAEMDRAGAQEVLLPSVQPAELWRESGRWEEYGPELLRLQDRHQRDFCLGPTHEEVITTLVNSEIRSYRQLPQNFYQIQTKFRDEIRPRFGVMRGREFIMKDAYSFHATHASLQQTYARMHAAYCAIFDRLGLRYRAVVADSGSIGGDASHEFHVLADSGEDTIVFSTDGPYAANMELAEALAPPPQQVSKRALALVDTPDVATIDDLVRAHKTPIEKTIKTLVVKAAANCPQPLVALLVRGDHQLNPRKAEKLAGVATPLRMAERADIVAAISAAPGSLGPVNLPIPFIADRAVAVMSGFAAGANVDGKHYFNINWQRDVELAEVADLRNVVVGEPSPDGQGELRIARGVEVGHIFQLGTKYSEAMGATVLDASGRAVPMEMGCYGIGVTRVIAAAIEQNHDAKGICWPLAIAPYHVVIVPIGLAKSEAVAQAATQLYRDLQAAAVEVVLDDRNERPGVMFADWELIGVPYRVVISERSLAGNGVEYYARADGESREILLKSVVTELTSAMKA